MSKQIGFVALTLLVIGASSPVFAQQPERSSKPAVSGKPAAKPATTRAIAVQESDEKPAPALPAAAPANEDKVVAKPAAPVAPVAKPADAGPPPAAEKPALVDKPPPVVKRPVLKEKPVVRAKPPHYRPRYGYGGYY
jgi:hypothetical protein